MSDRRAVVFVSTPLQESYVQRMREVDPERVEVLFHPEILPPQRYSIDHNGDPSFTLTPSQEALRRKCLKRANVLWGFPPDARDGTPFTDLTPELEWIHTTSSGIHQRVKQYGLADRNVVITNAAGVHAGPLTEFVFLCLTMASRRLLHLQRQQYERAWERFVGGELEGQTLGIVGTGAVGQRVIRVAKAFGMRVLALASPRSTRTAAGLGVDKLIPFAELGELLSEVDALVLIVPHTAETEGLIDGAALAAMKRGSVLVNIARGPVVDENALVDALRSGQLAFAGLDVFSEEPLPPDNPLWALPNVLISPHSSANADSENSKLTDLFCHNLRCFLAGDVSAMRNLFDMSRVG